MVPRFVRFGGIGGPAVLFAGILATAIAYSGRSGEAYSPFNHFISELGEVGVSSLAWLFNGSLVVSGLLMAVFLVFLGRHLGTRLGWAAAIAGAVAGLGASAVGLIPMNHLKPHLTAAFTFFDGGLVAVILFSAAILRAPRAGERARLGRWLLVPAAAACLAFASFLAWPYLAGAPDLRMLDPGSGVARVDVWEIAVLEWLVLVTVVGFIACSAVDLGRRQEPG